jgi:hypothetical protein
VRKIGMRKYGEILTVLWRKSALIETFVDNVGVSYEQAEGAVRAGKYFLQR